MGLINYLSIFASYWNSAISFFLPGNISHQLYVIIIDILILYVLTDQMIMKRRGVVPGKFFAICCISLFVAILFYSTTFIYGTPDRLYSSFWRGILAQSIPTILYASCIANDENCLRQMKRITPIVAIVFSIVAFFSIFAPTATTTGGFADTDYGLNYQTSSYMAAYAAGLAEYVVLFATDVNWKFALKKSRLKLLMIFLIIINAITILISGGRGGLAVFGIEIIVTIVLWVRRQGISILSLAKYIVIIAFIAISGYYVVRYASVSNIATSGFKRILAAIYEHDTAGRESFHSLAIQAFKESPIIGHGLGSVFYIIGNHAHGVYYDLMVEAGIIGILGFTICVVLFIQKLVRITRNDGSDCLLLYIFLDGLIMAMFSSYLLTQLPLLWTFSYVFSKDLRKKNEDE